MISFLVLILLVGLERLAELVVALRNQKWSIARGGREYGAEHYPFMVVLHTGLLVGCLLEVWLADRPFLPWLGWPMLMLVVAAQGLRWWCINTLGRRWNTRIIVIPGLPPIRTGPYAHWKHPNYVAVIVEGFALPLVHTAWLVALVFSVLNLVLLHVRVMAEESALAQAYPS